MDAEPDASRALRVFYEATAFDPVGVILRVAAFVRNPLTRARRPSGIYHRAHWF